MLFESSGMYNGEDVAVAGVSPRRGRLDAVWGSRRLSVRDIEESYRLRYNAHALAGVTSYIGSHLLSLLYLALYGRYISDTLSGARAMRVADACAIPSTLTHKRANQHLLTRLLRRKAEMFEVPVHFFAVSPAQVKRTTAFDGLQSIGTIIRGRIRRNPSSRRRHGRRLSTRVRPTPTHLPVTAAARALVVPAAGAGIPDSAPAAPKPS